MPSVAATRGSALFGCARAARPNCCRARASKLPDAYQEMRMSSSTLTPENLPAGRDRRIHQGHGTSALGPSDSSDSGSDLQGAPGIAHQDGADIGDTELDSDTDREGTGERAAADGEAPALDGADIGTDHIERIPDDDDEEET